MDFETVAGVSLLVGGILSAIITTAVIIELVFYVLRIIAGWKVFVKAGEKGWKSLIPIYNQIIQYKLTWKPIMLVPLLVLTIAGGVLVSLSNTVCVVIGFILVLAALVIEIIGLHKLSKAFGHGGGFTIGLIFLEGLFWLILGFSKSRYVGNTSETK